MNIDKFNRNVESFRKRVAALSDSYNEAIARPDLRKQFYDEELIITSEALQESVEELQQQNEELAAKQAVIEAQRQRYQNLFEFAPDGYLVTDVNATIQEANRAAAKLLNVSQRFLIGKPLSVFLAEEVRRGFFSKLNQIYQTELVQEWEVRLYPRRGVPANVALTVAVIRNQEGKPKALCWLLRDITERKQVEAALLRAKVAEAAKKELEKEIAIRKRVEQQLLHNAFYDALTGLPNRALFIKRLKRAIASAKQQPNYLFAVLFLDLDRFKVINDSLGHTFGDEFLIAIAGRLVACLRPTDIPARLGGDEFTILLEGIKNISDVVRVAERIQAELKLPFVLDKQEVFTTASIGIALSATGYEQPEDLLRDADTAMYRAKLQGKACYEIFNLDMHVQAVARLQLETELRLAVERQEFRVYYQPIVALGTGLIAGFEALVRWQHPVLGLVAPKDFMPVAVETGLSLSIDRWVMTQACYQIRQWQQHLDKQTLTISVNICSLHLAQPDLVEQINQVLWKTNLDASCLKLEITENVIMDNKDAATAKFAQLRANGIQLSIDDFGTGYSSLSRLYRIPVSMLKIDRDFISGTGIDEGNLEIVETIVTLAQKLGVEVTAEGVETAEQLVQLRALKCEYGQGYFFSPPVDSKAAEALIVENRQW